VATPGISDTIDAPATSEPAKAFDTLASFSRS
jgi:hypothetical protein